MFVALGTVVVSFGLTQSLLVPVLPLMQMNLGTDAAGITWALTIWLIAAAVATPLLGKIGDLVGRRRTFLAAVTVVALGLLIAAVAPNLRVLLFGQLLQGVGGGIYPLAYGLVRDSLPPRRVPAGIGVMAALISSGSAVGTVLAGPLSEVAGWRGVFALPLVGISIGAVLVSWSVPESTERAPGRINFLAAILLSTGLVALLVPLSSGSGWGWASRPVIGLLALAAILLAGWVVVELRSREPLVDMRMMQRPGIWNANIAAILIGAAMFGVWAFFARFLQEPRSTGYGLGASVSEAGMAMFPMLVLLPLAGFLVGPLGRIVRPSTQVVGGGVLVALSTASIALFHSHIWMLGNAGAFFGLGLGLFYAAMTTVIVQSVPATHTGIAAGMNTNFRMIGSGIGTALMTAIVTGSAGVGGAPTEAGYVIGFLVLAAIAAVAAVVSALSP